MTFAELINHGKKFAIDNAPTILTGVAAVGVVGTAYLTGRGTLEAHKALNREKLRQAEKYGVATRDPNQILLTPQEKLKICWKHFMPAAGVGALTIIAIIGSNKIGTNRAAGLAAAYSLSERGFKEYKEHVKEKFGENKEREVRDELAQKKVNENPPSPQFMMMGTPGKIPCLDMWTRRYFWTTMETVKKAQNDIDYKALHEGYPSLTDFYHAIGLEPTAASDSVGWTSSNRPEVSFSATLAEPFEGQGTIPVMVISHMNEPQPNYWKPSAAY